MEKNERHKSLAMAQVAELDPSLHFVYAS
jgi:hypothetical protein